VYSEPYHVIIQRDIIRKYDVQFYDLMEFLYLGIYGLSLVVRPAQFVIIVPGQL